ncbi:hypothetical protein [Pseudomonas sp. SO81]|uniref:hypothetical protein n=1 Tax=Pseudomonas sp. SO81 TaxID=2983246 RepID=UPI0025A329D8|nr:hypothetical protein [Pseudomonas sp. SO81]
MKALDADGFVEAVLQLAAELGLKIEERRPGWSICFNETSDKWLSEQHLRQLYPAILEADLSDARINQLIEQVAPGRPCTHVGMRQIVARLHEVGGWAPGAGG